MCTDLVQLHAVDEWLDLNDVVSCFYQLDIVLHVWVLVIEENLILQCNLRLITAQIVDQTLSQVFDVDWVDD